MILAAAVIIVSQSVGCPSAERATGTG